MKILNLDELNSITSKLLEGFIKVNFLYQHIKDVRKNFRDTLLKQLKNDEYIETLKIVDEINDLLIQILWSFNSQDFYQISITPYEHIKIKMKPIISMKVRENIPIQLLAKFKTKKHEGK